MPEEESQATPEAEEAAENQEPEAVEAEEQPSEPEGTEEIIERGAMEAAIAEEPDGRALELDEFGSKNADSAGGSIDLLLDVDLEVKIELGRAEMPIEGILKLKEGSVVELDKLAGDPVDILVNERLVARGEILVVNDNFCVRITDIVDPEAGLKAAEVVDEADKKD